MLAYRKTSRVPSGPGWLIHEQAAHYIATENEKPVAPALSSAVKASFIKEF